MKIVPDPPAPRLTTAHTHFGSCNGTHAPLFTVCEGLSLEDALVHVTSSLTSAYETNFQVCETGTRPVQSLAWATQHSLEIALAV
ncbi:MAG: DUF3077 domain-containing protein, partial [Pseudomonas putida]|nr:DUF3077 domain-containing protein [Pseudomonas putida]